MKTALAVENSKPLILPQMAETLEEIWELCEDTTNPAQLTQEIRSLIEKVMKRYYKEYESREIV